MLENTLNDTASTFLRSMLPVPNVRETWRREFLERTKEGRCAGGREGVEKFPKPSNREINTQCDPYLRHMAKEAAADGGAGCTVSINTITGMAVTVTTRKSFCQCDRRGFQGRQ